MPHRNPPDLSDVNKLLDQAFQALVVEARSRNALAPPFGQSSFPDPRKVLEEPDVTTGYDGDEIPMEQEGDAPEEDGTLLSRYRYQYGFNPLVFLGEYLIQNSPVRMELQKAAEEKARKAALASSTRAIAYSELSAMVKRRRSGILFGPFAGEVSSDSVTLWTKAFRAGLVTFDVCESGDFPASCKVFSAEVEVDITSECSTSVRVDGLTFSTTYYYRACLTKPSYGLMGRDGGCFGCGHFTTLPDPTSTKCNLSFTMLSTSSLLLAPSASLALTAISLKPSFCIAIGDFATENSISISNPGTAAWWVKRYRAWHAMLDRSTELKNLLSSVAITTVPYCSSFGGDAAGDSETVEAGFKTLCDYWPVRRGAEGFTCHVIGRHVELYTIESIGGLIEPHVAQHLTKRILGSNSSWKLLVCGGVSVASAPPPPGSPSSKLGSDPVSLCSLGGSLYSLGAWGVVLIHPVSLGLWEIHSAQQTRRRHRMLEMGCGAQEPTSDTIHNAGLPMLLPPYDSTVPAFCHISVGGETGALVYSVRGCHGEVLAEVELQHEVANAAHAHASPHK